MLTVEVAVYSKDPYDLSMWSWRILHTEVAGDGAYVQRAIHHQRLKETDKCFDRNAKL